MEKTINQETSNLSESKVSKPDPKTPTQDEQNSIEAGFTKEVKPMEAEKEAARNAWLSNAEEESQDKPLPPKQAEQYKENQVESDEVFTATQPDIRPIVPSEVEMKYLRVGDTFYNSKNTDLVAFEDRGNKLLTKTNSEQVAEDMVRVAEARGWDEINVRGTEQFRFKAWHEAALRGMHVRGYTPTETQIAQVEAERKSKGIDDKPVSSSSSGDNKADKAPEQEKDLAKIYAESTQADALRSRPELAGAYAIEAAIDKKAEADGLTPQQRAVVGARVRQNIVNSIEKGKMPEVKIKEEVKQEREQTPERELSR